MNGISEIEQKYFKIVDGNLELPDKKIDLLEINNVKIEQEYSFPFLVFVFILSTVIFSIFMSLGIKFAEIVFILSVFIPIFGPIFILVLIFIIYMVYKVGQSFKNPYRLMIYMDTESITLLETPNIVLVNATKRALEKALAKACAEPNTGMPPKR